MGGGPRIKPDAQGQKGNQSKRPAEEATGLSPEHKRVSSPAPTRRERSQEVSKGGAGHAKLAQSKMDSFVSPAGATDKGKGGPGGNASTPPDGSHTDKAAAYPPLPGAPPPPSLEFSFLNPRHVPAPLSASFTT